MYRDNLINGNPGSSKAMDGRFQCGKRVFGKETPVINFGSQQAESGKYAIAIVKAGGRGLKKRMK